MMHARGHTIYFYGHIDSVVDCTEKVPIIFHADTEKAYPGWDWKKDGTRGNTSDHVHTVFNERAIHEVGLRKKANDFLLCFWGFAHKSIADAHRDLIAVDPTVGIDHHISYPFAVFASYSIMNRVYGKCNMDPRWYDSVIPHFFDTAEFEFNATPKDYFLYVGRVINSKGINIAIDAAFAAGVKLIVAGVGSVSSIRGSVPSHVVEIGSVGPVQRNELMKNAKAFIAPSHYSEPFGMAVVEAMICGTPVITTDWGGFAETVLHGTTGYRCRTMEQFTWAAKNIDKIRREDCREWAIKNHSFERIANMYEEYFNTLIKVTANGGFYASDPDRTDLDWLVRYYPTSS